MNEDERRLVLYLTLVRMETLPLNPQRKLTYNSQVLAKREPILFRCSFRR